VSQLLSGIGIDPDTAEVADHSIATERIGAILEMLSRLVYNRPHPSVTLVFIDGPSRADLVVCVMSYHDSLAGST
jgi:hypothetical protein